MKIFIIGGYGYKNVGDEAQLSGNLQTIKHLFKDSNIVVASPHPDYTKKFHNCNLCIEALRSCYFNQHNSRRFQIVHKNKKSIFKYIGNEFYKLRFIIDSLILIADSLFLLNNIPIRLVSNKTRSFTTELFTSDILFFSGGGYLSEPTLSRLWDGYLHIILAKLANNKIVLSGQTLGPINSSFNKYLARKLFNLCNGISLRDNQKSLQFLDSLNLSIPFFVICDDATFCHKSLSNISKSGDFIAYHLHYWGADNKLDKKKILNQNVLIIKYLIRSGYTVKLISMTPSDEKPLTDLYKILDTKSLVLLPFHYDINFIISIFYNALFTLTMKHHPIVFSISQITPVISLNYTDYYRHKNGGALALFGLSKFSFNLLEDLDKIKSAIIYLSCNTNRKTIHSMLELKLRKKLEERQHYFREFLY
jgi:polysaccharide pyruvyl transferase WcaK-like protein